MWIKEKWHMLGAQLPNGRYICNSYNEKPYCSCSKSTHDPTVTPPCPYFATVSDWDQLFLVNLVDPEVG